MGIAMFNTIRDLLQESRKIADAQPSEFQETLSFVTSNAADKSIIELINIVSDTNEPTYVTTTRI